MSKIKYMGTSDVRRMKKGDTFGGQLADGLSADVEFSWDNDHVIDTDEAGLSTEEVGLILAQPDFKDVTDAKRIPLGEAQKMWKGMKTAPVNPDADTVEADTEVSEPSKRRGARAEGPDLGGAATETQPTR